jgi:hypothetical protein
VDRAVPSAIFKDSHRAGTAPIDHSMLDQIAPIQSERRTRSQHVTVVGEDFIRSVFSASA